MAALSVMLAAVPVLRPILIADQRPPPVAAGSRLLDLSLFRDHSFGLGLVLQLLFWAGQGSFFVVLALYLQQGRGLHAMGAGLVFTILAAAYLIASSAAPGLSAKHGYPVVVVGALTLAGGHGLLLAAAAHIDDRGSIVWLVPGLLLVGAGMGLVIAPLATLLLGS